MALYHYFDALKDDKLVEWFYPFHLLAAGFWAFEPHTIKKSSGGMISVSVVKFNNIYWYSRFNFLLQELLRHSNV